MFGRSDQNSAWRSRFPERVTCVRCLQEKDILEMDRLLWCEACRNVTRRRAGVWGWGAGAVLAAFLALWIWLVIRPSNLVLGGWIATVVAALWIGGRIGREVAFGIMRYRNTKAVEAVPPTDSPGAPGGAPG